MSDYSKLHRCTDRDECIIGFYLYLIAALLAVRRLIQRARTRYRRDNRPAVRRLTWSLLLDALTGVQEKLHRSSVCIWAWLARLCWDMRTNEVAP